MALKAKVLLRRAEREDLDTVVAWREDPDFMRFLYGDRTATPKQVREQIVNMLGRTMGYAAPGGIHLIVETARYGPVGMHSIVNIGWRNRSCNVDTYFIEKVRNSFISTISFYRVMDYCFGVLNMHRVNLYVYAFNPRSWRLIEKKGHMRRELVLNKHVPRDGELHDMYGYGMLPEDWAQNQEYFTEHFRGIGLQSMIEAYRQGELAALAEQDADTEAGA